MLILIIYNQNIIKQQVAFGYYVRLTAFFPGQPG